MPTPHDNSNQAEIVVPATKSIRRGEAMRTAIFALAGGGVLFVIGMAASHMGLFGASEDADRDPQIAAQDGAAQFTPPPLSAIPDDENGTAIRRGMAIFLNTKTNASDYVGNDLACVNCHLDAGRKPNAAPMWAAWVAYPKYRSKNGKINTMEDRLKGCFTYSMNGQGSPSGGPPPVGSDVYRDLEIYFRWLASGAPTSEKMEGAGYPKLEKPANGYDRKRGAKIFEENCASCHGADGQGQRDINGRIVFPPLWGPGSYNWGAGMGRVNTAAAFIKENMPLGQENRLTDQEAWDVAAFVDSHERPKDPRQTGTVEQNAKDNHGGESFYGKTLDGHLLGTGVGNPDT